MTEPTPSSTGTALFRAQALEQLASPDRIDVAARVVRPSGWVALAALALILLGGIGGMALVSVPVQIAAGGIVQAEAAPVAVRIPQAGTVTALRVQPGDDVEKGDVLAILAPGGPVQAPLAGLVSALPAAPGAALEAGAPLAGIIPAAGPVSVVLFLRPAAAQTVRAGMTAQVTVEGGQAIALTGHVSEIATRPASPAAMARELGHAALANAYAQAGNTIAIRIALDGPVPPGLANLLCRIAITTGTRNVLQMILPGGASIGPG